MLMFDANDDTNSKGCGGGDDDDDDDDNEKVGADAAYGDDDNSERIKVFTILSWVPKETTVNKYQCFEQMFPSASMQCRKK